MGPQNVIMGNDNVATGGQAPLPPAQADDTQMKELKAAARFAKSKEYKELKDHFQKRVAFYQTYLPDGKAVGAQEANQDTANMWIVANIIIGEFNAIINVYDSADEMLKQAQPSDETS